MDSLRQQMRSTEKLESRSDIPGQRAKHLTVLSWERRVLNRKVNSPQGLAGHSVAETCGFQCPL